jgi:hypothetical protein
MGSFSVADVMVGGLDAIRAEILEVYAKYDPVYAVYRTGTRTAVQFADDPKIEKAQRSSLSKLAPLRSEISGLIDGWRNSERTRFRDAALRYERRVAGALVTGFDGDVDLALVILGQIRDDIVAERKSRARFLYLIWAAATVALIALVAALLTSQPAQSALRPYDAQGANLWRAVVAGSLGAFFSIARAISDRSIHTDQQMSDNVTDAILRILIGATAAMVLQALLDSQLVSIHLGSAVIGAAPGRPPATPWLMTLVAGFLAGFSERLVPDLLNSATIAAADPPQSEAPKPAPEKPKGADGGQGGGGPTPGAEPSPVAEAGADAEEDVDGCDVDPADSGVPPTPDEQLPPAAGGVAQP